MDVAHRLRDEGYRLTPQRRLVWDALHRAEGHLTAEQIHGAVSQVVPDFNVASVYRTLTLLSDLGLAKEVRLGDGRGYWELTHSDDVVHLHCRACRSVDHHTADFVADIRSHLAADHGFDPEDVEVVVHGLCSDCASAPAAR